MAKPQNNVHKALEKLGNTPEAIRDKLVELNCQGNLQNSSSCPIAVYLNKVVPNIPHRNTWTLEGNFDKSVQVGYRKVQWAKKGKWAAVILPLPARQFLQDFDKSKYPELEK